jgi:hypothetical protein
VHGSPPFQYWTGGEKVSGPLNPEAIRKELCNYVPELRDFLVGVAEFGFAVVPPGEVNKIPSYEVDNYASIEFARTLLSTNLREEEAAGKIERVEVRPQCVSARGAVPKRDYNEPDGASKVKFRLITDCSAPIGRALNEWTTSPSFNYAKFDIAVKESAPGVWYVKIDLKAAYRHVPLHRAMWTLFGFKWDFTPGEYVYFVDKFLPFGIKPACWLFTQFTRAICWRCRELGVHVIIGYIDDFLIIEFTKEGAEIGLLT